LKIKNLIIEINSIGDGQCRPYYKKILTNYFRNREQFLCSDCKKRLKENVLRILDCKEEKCQQLKSEAPQILNNLCDECRNHFKQVLEFIDELNLPYNLNPYLVRGIDYYTNTVFEFFSDDKENGGNKNALGGGGRYDKLVKILGGKDVPGCGAAVGVERVIDLMRDKEQFVKKREIPVFIAQLGDLAKRKSLKIFEQFRKAKISVGESFGRDSLKAQLARANKLGVKYSLIIGQKEALEGKIIIRNMENGQQDIVKLDEVVEEIKKRLKK
jgi:histidyl-tRNA synthetase